MELATTFICYIYEQIRAAGLPLPAHGPDMGGELVLQAQTSRRIDREGQDDHQIGRASCRERV